MRRRDPHRRDIAARIVTQRADTGAPPDVTADLDRGHPCICGHRQGWHLDLMWCTFCTECHELGGYTPADLSIKNDLVARMRLGQWVGSVSRG